METSSFKAQFKQRLLQEAFQMPLLDPSFLGIKGNGREGTPDLAVREGWMSGSPQPTAHCPPLACPPTGYLLALGPLLFISICDVWLQLFSRDQAYAINLVAVGTVAFGCTGRDRGGGRGQAEPQVPTASIPPPALFSRLGRIT